MPVKPVITNNTPLVALWTLGQLALLRPLFGEIWLPPAVYNEFIAHECGARLRALEKLPWLRTVPLVAPHQAAVYIGLDQGEAEVLALAEEHQARLVIMDELRGRRYAHRLGLACTGTLGVLLLAKEQGLLAEVAPWITTLRTAGLYLADNVVAEALRLAGEN